MAPFFSIIIPVYNVAHCLRECLDSVLAQSFTDWEAICVDDGSTDGSGGILDEYAATDSRFKVIHQKNSKVSAARNAALSIVRGEWVSFVDSDDVVLKGYLESFVKLEHKGDITFFPMMYKWSSGERLTVGIENPEYSEDSQINANTILRLVKNPTGHNIFAYVPNKFIKRDVIEKYHIRFIEGLSLSEDEIFMFEVCHHVKSIALMKSPLYEYRCDDCGLSCSRNRPCEWLFDLYRKVGDDDNRCDFKRAAYRLAYMVAQEELARSGSWRFCRRFILFFREVNGLLDGGMHWFSFVRFCSRIPCGLGTLGLFARSKTKHLAKLILRIVG